jgi:hypothetical protein
MLTTDSQKTAKGPILLSSQRIPLSDDPRPFLEAICSGKEEVFYTCWGVSQYGLPQRIAFETLVEKTHDKTLRCSLAADVWKLHHKERDDLPQVDPEDNKNKREELIFYYPKFEQKPHQLCEEKRVQQIWELEDEVIRPVFPGYEVGPPLRKQNGPGAEEIRNRLRRGVTVLESFKFIELEAPTVDGYLPYSHSSLFLLTVRALGVPRIRDIREFLNDPTRFLTEAIINALVPEEEQKEEDFVLLKKKLTKQLHMTGLSTEAFDTPVRHKKVCLPLEVSWSVLDQLKADPVKDPPPVAELLDRMDSLLLKKEYSGFSQYKKIEYLSRLLKFSYADIGVTIGENEATVQNIIESEGKGSSSSDVQDNLYGLLIVFSGLLRLSQYKKKEFCQLFEDTTLFAAYLSPPPWYPDSLRKYLLSKKKEAIQQSALWLKNN